MTAARTMLSRGTLAAIGKVQSREEFCHCLGRIAAETGASHYLLMLDRHVRGASQAHVVASNWIFDTVQTIGAESLLRFAQSSASHEPSAQACRVPLRGADGTMAEKKMRTALGRHGHADMHALPIRDASRRCYLLLSSPKPGAIVTAMLPSARLACCYLLARPPVGLFEDPSDEALSDRERECLYWVAEGKTAGEVAMILGVKANTVNSYLNHAIRKIGASNRAMAIATAIRAGVI